MDALRQFLQTPLSEFFSSRKKLMSLISFLIIFYSLPLTLYLVFRPVRFEKRAVAPEAAPANVRIANLHGEGFSISWTSVDPTTEAFQETTGSVVWGKDPNNLDQEAFDDQGQEFSTTKYSSTHHVSLSSLDPDTTYYFKIKSGPDLYGKHPTENGWVKEGASVPQPTPPSLPLTGTPHPLFGEVKDQAGSRASGVLVYIQVKKDDSQVKSSLFSTVTLTSEGWVVDASNAREESLSHFFGFDDNDRVLVEAQAGLAGKASGDFVLSSCSLTSAAASLCNLTLVPLPTSTPPPALSPTPTSIPTPTPGGPPDTTPPTVSITSPADGAEIKRNTKITIETEAADNVGVVKLDFAIDGKVSCSDTEAPYTCEYRLKGKPNKVYSIEATAFDAAGNNGFHRIQITATR